MSLKNVLVTGEFIPGLQTVCSVIFYDLFSKAVVAKIDELHWYPQHKHPISSTKNPSLHGENQGRGVCT